MRFDTATIALMASQAGVVSRRQLLRAGWTGPQIDSMVRHGHLRRVAHGVYLRTGVEEGHQQRAMIAVLRARTPARVTGELILARLGCEGFDPEEATFTILLSRPRQLVPTVGFAHRLDPAPGRDEARYGALPGTTPARTILELAVDLAADDQVLLAADRLRWRCQTRASDLARLVDQLPEHPGASRLRDLGLLDEGQPESPGERGLAAVVAAAGIEVEWQVWIAPDLRVDALWREAGVALEHDGSTHADGRDRLHDQARDTRIRELGYLPVHTTAADAAHPAELVARLHRIAVRRRDAIGA